MFSKKLNQYINNNNTISIDKLSSLLGSNSFFYLLFIVTFLTSIPSPIWALGTSTVPSGILTLLISSQMILGRKHIYLPAFLKKKNIKTKTIKTMEKYLSKLKTKSNSSKFFFENIILEKISAILIFFCGILMAMPIILTNWAPSFAVTFISISHILKNKFLLFLCYVLTLLMLFGYIYFFKIIIKYAKKFFRKFNIKFN